MQINIYWSDLSTEGQETLINAGLVLLPEHISDKEPIGIFDSEKKDN